MPPFLFLQKKAGICRVLIDYFVFVDESGDLGALGTGYFIIVAVQVKDDRALGRVIKRVRERKLGKKLVEVPEIKANLSPSTVRKAVLEKVAKLDCKIYALAVDKKRVVPQLMSAPNKLYNWLCRLLCQQIQGQGEMRIVMDKKYNNKLLREGFNNYLVRQLSFRGIKASVTHLESQSCQQLQAVDFVAWAVNRKFSHGDSAYYEIIREKIANKGDEELWK